MTAAEPPRISKTDSRAALWLLCCGLPLLVLLAYGNHFQNPFHFDDSHAIVDNPYIRELRGIPRFFTDGTTSGTLPANRVYRPVVYTSLAVDYWLGKGLNPVWFHVSTFFWFLIQLGLMFLLFRGILNRTRPEAGRASSNMWIALFATALYGVHPVTAETVNYIVQRADLYAALAVVAGLVAYIELPQMRRYGLYLIPVVAGVLSKPPAAVFPVLLFAWIWLFDNESFSKSVLRSIPALAVTGCVALFTVRMTPATYIAGGASAYAYRITQPAVLLGYFLKFFVPAGLSADTDRVAYTSMAEPGAIWGLLFMAALIAAAVGCTRRREMRPVAFGLIWFLVASIPTSVINLAEVENDHRMYLPFVGLALATCWGAALWIERRAVPSIVVFPVCILILIGFAAGTRQRNKVWSSDEALWHDVTVKSPRNGRGLMNYGLALMAKGDIAGALDCFQRAKVLTPNYYILEINLGVANTSLGNLQEAERHFRRAIELSPEESSPRYYYARWLDGVGRAPEALEQVLLAIRQNPDYVPSRYLLMKVYSDLGNTALSQQAARDTLARFPSDTSAAAWLVNAGKPGSAPHPVPQAPAAAADVYVGMSLQLYQAHKYKDCIDAARQALKIRPDYAEAWNNIGAAYNAMAQWDDGIAASKEAIRLKPDFQLAKNNLALAESEKRKAAVGAPQANP